MTDPCPGDICRHFKGNIYIVLALARHTWVKEELVIYQDLKTGAVWARPINNFSEKVVVQEASIERFKRLK